MLDTYLAYERDLEALIAEGKGDSKEADDLRDQLTHIFFRELNREERASVAKRPPIGSRPGS